MSQHRFGDANSAMIRAGRAQLRRRAALASQRRVRVIDAALNACEEANLGQPLTPDSWSLVLRLIHRLQVESGRRRRRPKNAIQAHEELLRLQRRYLMRRPWDR
jgi:hypothetical protein